VNAKGGAAAVPAVSAAAAPSASPQAAFDGQPQTPSTNGPAPEHLWVDSADASCEPRKTKPPPPCVWSAEEDRRLAEAQTALGSTWSMIAKMFPGRTDGALRQRWHRLTTRKGLEYIVEAITGERRSQSGGLQYCVRWEGFPDPADSTWEPAITLENCAALDVYLAVAAAPANPDGLAAIPAVTDTAGTHCATTSAVTGPVSTPGRKRVLHHPDAAGGFGEDGAGSASKRACPTSKGLHR